MCHCVCGGGISANGFSLKTYAQVQILIHVQILIQIHVQLEILIQIRPRCTICLSNTHVHVQILIQI